MVNDSLFFCLEWRDVSDGELNVLTTNDVSATKSFESGSGVVIEVERQSPVSCSNAIDSVTVDGVLISVNGSWKRIKYKQTFMGTQKCFAIFGSVPNWWDIYFISHISLVSIVHLESRGKGRVGILWYSLILNLEKDFERSVHQLSFYLRNSLCMELFREFNFPFPNPSSNYFFLYWVRKHLCISWTCSFGKSLGFLAVNLIYLERLQFTCFKALRKSNYNIIWRKAKITCHRGLSLRFGVKRGKTRAYQAVSLLKQSSDFFILAKETFCPSNNPWLIISSLQGLWYIQSRCFEIRP